MPARRHAEIAGAGLGGLTLAAALAQRGWSVRVHERAPQLAISASAPAYGKTDIRRWKPSGRSKRS